MGYALPPLTSTWTHYEINLGELGTTFSDIAGIRFENATGSAQPAYYSTAFQLGFAIQPTPPAPSRYTCVCDRP